MKKKNNKNIFKIILNLFERIFITPISKLILKITDAPKSNKNGIERVLNNKQSLLIISLIAAFTICFVTRQKLDTFGDNSAEILYNQPVRAIYNEELYVIEGVPETADVTLVGRKSDVYLAKQFPEDEIVLDLQNLSVGTHKVSTKYTQAVSTVEYKVDPSNVTVVIYEKMSENRELSYDVIHKDKLDTKLNVESINLSRDDVIIKGAEDEKAKNSLSKVASVKALIDIENIQKKYENGEIKVGSMTMKDVPLVAYDEEGNTMDVEIVPAKVDATVKISSPSKKVPIKVEAEGSLNNKAIKSITQSSNTVTIYGTESSLEEIEYVSAIVNMDGITSNTKYTINLKKPSGVREMSVNQITVSVELDKITTKEVTGIKINSVNLGNGLSVQALSKEDSSITVILSGSESVLKTIDTSTINAYIDLEGLGVGDHEVDIKVSGTDNRVEYKAKIKSVKIRISK